MIETENPRCVYYIVHLPDSRDTQITAYFCMQLASKASSLISCIIHVSSQPISVSVWVVKMCKIWRKNILKRPILKIDTELILFQTKVDVCPQHAFKCAFRYISRLVNEDKSENNSSDNLSHVIIPLAIIWH